MAAKPDPRNLDEVKRLLRQLEQAGSDADSSDAAKVRLPRPHQPGSMRLEALPTISPPTIPFPPQALRQPVLPAAVPAPVAPALNPALSGRVTLGPRLGQPAPGEDPGRTAMPVAPPLQRPSRRRATPVTTTIAAMVVLVPVGFVWHLMHRPAPATTSGSVGKEVASVAQPGAGPVGMTAAPAPAQTVTAVVAGPGAASPVPPTPVVRVQPAPQGVVLAPAPPAAAPAAKPDSDVAGTSVTTAVAVALARAEPVAAVTPGPSAQPATPPPATPRPPAMADQAPVDDVLVKSLLSQASLQLEAGHVGSARLLLQRAVEAGSAEAALQLGDTFDAARLYQLGVRGMQGDSAKAIHWYERADELGAAQAKARLLAVSGR